LRTLEANGLPNRPPVALGGLRTVVLLSMQAHNYLLGPPLYLN